MAVEITTLELDARLKNAEATIAGLNGIKTAGTGAEMSFGKLAFQIAGLNTGFGLAVQAGRATIGMVKDLAVESVTLAASFERSRITWGVLMQDMSAGADIFEDIRKFSAETPLTFRGAEQAGQQLKGMGVAGDDLIETLSDLGDLAQGNDEKLQRISRAYGQVIAKGKADTRDLWQFVDAGVPIVDLLGKSMGKTGGEILKMTADGELSFGALDAAITKATDEGGQFYGMMDKVAETASGRWSTAVDDWSNILARIGDTVLPAATRALRDFSTTINAVLDQSEYLDFFKSPTTFSGDFSAVERVLNKMEALNEKSSGMNKSGMRKFIDERQSTLASAISAAESDALEMGRLGNTSLLGRSIGQGSQLTAWSEYEKQADNAVANRFREITDEASTAKSLGREYDIDKEKNKVIDEWIDFLLNLSPTQVNETFKPTDRSIQELVAQRAKTGGGSFYMGLDPEIAKNIDSGSYVKSPFAAVPTDFSGGLTGTTMTAMGGVTNPVFDPESLKRLEDMDAAMQSLYDGMQSIANSAITSTFESIGESLAAGASGGQTFAEAMSSIGQQATSQFGSLMTTLGLELLVSSNGLNPVGWAFLAAGGIVSIGAGAWGYSNSSSSSSTSTAAEEINAELASYYLAAEAFNQKSRNSAALTGYANGTNYAAGGWSWVGEKGPELMRVPQGSQIIPNHVAKGYADGLNIPMGVVVNVTPPKGYTADTEESTDSNGLRTVEVYVRKVVKAEMAKQTATGRRVST